MNKRKLITIGAVLAQLAGTSMAGTYYVSTNGNDSNNGSSGAPFRTLTKAHSAMSSGDTCIVREGVYRETLTITKNNLKFKAGWEQEHKVIIDATKVVNEWYWYENNIYVSNNVTMDLGAELNQVYHNNSLMDLARWPNNSDNDPFTFDGHAITGGSASRIDASGMPSNLTGGYFCYLGEHCGTTWSRKITSRSGNSIYFDGVDIEEWPYSNHNPTYPDWKTNRGQMYLYGKLNLLDAPREWFYDSDKKKLYLRTSDGTKPADWTVEVPARKNCIVVEGDDVHIEGLRIFGGNVVLEGDNATFFNNHVIHGKQVRSIDRGATYGDGALAIKGADSIILNNKIKYGSINGVLISSGGIGGLLESNEIKYFNTQGIHSSPVRSSAKNLIIQNNVISHGGRDVLYAVGNGSKVSYNDVSNGLLINDDGGLFYTVGSPGVERNIEIHHNWFHDTRSRSYTNEKGAGVYLDNNSMDFNVHHNVIWNTHWSGIQMNWENRYNKMRQNSLWNVGQAMGRWENGYEVSNNQVLNCYSSIGDWLSGSGFWLSNNKIDSASPFVNPWNNNFMPKRNSILLDGGMTIDSLSQYEVGTPDIGAYELGATRWRPGLTPVYHSKAQVSYRIKDDGTIWKWDGSTFVRFGPTASRLSRIDVGEDDIPWGINVNGEVYEGDSSGWTKRGSGAQDIACGDGKVYITKTDDTIWEWDGSDFVRFGPTGARLEWIDVGDDGNPWGINAAGNVYKWDGSAWIYKASDGFDIGVGCGRVFLTKRDNTIWEWNGSSFIRFGPTGSRLSIIDVGEAGMPWGINEAGNLYSWSGSSWVYRRANTEDIGL